MAIQAEAVVDMLKNRGLLNESQADDFLGEAHSSGKTLMELTVDYGIFHVQDEFWAAVAEEIGAEYYDLSTFEPATELLQEIPAGMARLCGAFPVLESPEGVPL